MYQVLKTGSKGNAVIYHKSIMIDCGVSYSLIKEHVNSLQLLIMLVIKIWKKKFGKA